MNLSIAEANIIERLRSLRKSNHLVLVVKGKSGIEEISLLGSGKKEEVGK